MTEHEPTKRKVKDEGDQKSKASDTTGRTVIALDGSDIGDVLGLLYRQGDPIEVLLSDGEIPESVTKYNKRDHYDDDDDGKNHDFDKDLLSHPTEKT